MLLREAQRERSPGYSWDGRTTGIYPVAPPALKDRDVLLFDEPGRCGGMDSHSHHYRIVTDCGLALLVAHGGGEERMRLSLPSVRDGQGGGAAILAALDSNARYWILNAIYHAHSDGKHEGETKAREQYVSAFIAGRLRKRKSPGRNYHRVWIEPASAGLVLK